MRRLLISISILSGVFLATEARAGLLPVSVTTAPEGDFYRWTYSLTLPTETMLRSGDYFTIYDFAGYRPGSMTAPANWTGTSAERGPVPPGLLPSDTNLPNLTWTYTGPTITAGAADLGTFSALSPYQVSTEGPFTARTHRTSDGLPDANITTTTVPVPQVPEPSTLLLAGLGLPALGFARRWWKRA